MPFFIPVFDLIVSFLASCIRDILAERRGSVVGSGSGKVAAVALGSTQPLTEMGTTNLPGV
jgi:hypothetical protein